MLLRLSNLVETAIAPALALLGKPMDGPEARCIVLAIGLQESEFVHRRQLAGGPARSFWGFELGTAESHGGVTGVYMHHSSHEPLRLLCHERDVPFEPRPIYNAIENDDVLAAGVARLLLLTDPLPLPKVGEEKDAWLYYKRNWNPGRPRPKAWPGNYRLALSEVQGKQ